MNESGTNLNWSVPSDALFISNGWIEGDVPMFLWIVFLGEFATEVAGFVLNTFIYDNSLRLPVTSGSIWMRYLAFWDNACLTVSIINSAMKFNRIDFESLNSVSCKLLFSSWFALKLNSASHLAAFAVDRVFSLSFPVWHFKKKWAGIIRCTSCFLTLLNFCFALPSWFFYQVKDGTCQMTNGEADVIKVYLISFLTWFVVVYNLSILLSTLFMVSVLRKRSIINSSGTNEEMREREDPGESSPQPSSPQKSANVEDEKAIRTVTFTCTWYMIHIIIYSALIFIRERPGRDRNRIPMETRMTVKGFGRWFFALGNSLNFLFYMRGKTFSNVFRQNWATRWQRLTS